MKYRSVFDIIGPIMIGPSSSHTAGAVRIGLLGRKLFGKSPTKADIELFGSFAKTYKGHGTDIAIIGGILGLNTYDPNLIQSYELAKQMGVDVRIRTSEKVPAHPNTAILTLSDGNESVSLLGVSHGGGKVEVTEVDGYGVQLWGESPAILIWHRKQSDITEEVTQLLKGEKVKVRRMETVSRKKEDPLLTIVETDQLVQEDVLHKLKTMELITKVIRLESIS